MINSTVQSIDTIKILLVEDHIMARMGTALFIKNNPDFDLIGQAYTIKLWVKIVFKYPREAVESFLCNSYGYWSSKD